MRLIDADLLREHLFVTESRTGGSREEQAYEKGWDDALKSVMAYEPTVYAVKVVRCKDCRFFKADKRFGECHKLRQLMYDDDFCSHAMERRDDEGFDRQTGGD